MPPTDGLGGIARVGGCACVWPARAAPSLLAKCIGSRLQRPPAPGFAAIASDDAGAGLEAAAEVVEVDCAVGCAIVDALPVLESGAVTVRGAGAWV